jgi:hypothetical protein
MMKSSLQAAKVANIAAVVDKRNRRLRKRSENRRVDRPWQQPSREPKRKVAARRISQKVVEVETKRENVRSAVPMIVVVAKKRNVPRKDTMKPAVIARNILREVKMMRVVTARREREEKTTDQSVVDLQGEVLSYQNDLQKIGLVQRVWIDWCRQVPINAKNF